jgi:hypothetical protein
MKNEMNKSEAKSLMYLLSSAKNDKCVDYFTKIEACACMFAINVLFSIEDPEMLDRGLS